MNPKVIVGTQRNIPLVDYFEKLQLEYIVADLRQRIYPNTKDKNFYLKLKEKKKNKIEDIAERNYFPTIFTDKVYRQNMRENIIPEWGFPVFIYANQEQLLKFQVSDITYYYSVGVDVKVNLDGQIKIGKIKFFDYNKDQVHVKLQKSGEVRIFGIEDISRVL